MNNYLNSDYTVKLLKIKALTQANHYICKYYPKPGEITEVKPYIQMMRKRFLAALATFAIVSVAAFTQQDIHPLPHKLQRCRVEHGETVVLVRLKDANCIASRSAYKKALARKKQQDIIASKPLAKNETTTPSLNL